MGSLVEQEIVHQTDFGSITKLLLFNCFFFFETQLMAICKILIVSLFLLLVGGPFHMPCEKPLNLNRGLNDGRLQRVVAFLPL